METFFAIFSRNIIKVKPDNTDKIIENKNKEITTYIRSLFHDIRIPLNNLSLGIDVLNEIINKDDVQINEIISMLKNSIVFTNDLLNSFIKINYNYQNNTNTIDLKCEPFNLLGLIKKIEYLLHFNISEKNIKFKYNISKNFNEWVISDYNNLQNVFLNLLSNSVKFSKKDSIITIKITSFTVGKTQNITISILDNNNHIPIEIKRHLFEKYNTSDKLHGTGLGLYMCKRIIEAHNGTIRHDYSFFPYGNMFTIKINSNIFSTSNNRSVDISQKITNIDTPAAVVAANVNTTENFKIALIDDSETSRKMLKRMIYLKSNSIDIYEAEDGLDAILKIHDKLNEIDIIFIDNTMPNINGILTTKILRGLSYNNLIIGVTGNSVCDDIDEFYKNGANYVFTKPFTKENLDSLYNFIKINSFSSRKNQVIINDNNVLKWS
jgi:CheY-like chemotaxis protein